MPPSSESLSSGSQSGQDGRAPSAAVASAAFSSSAAATGAPGGNSFFGSVASGELFRRRELSEISPGGYGSTAAAVARVASANFIYRLMGFAIRPVSMVPRYQPALSIGGESKTMESSLFQRRERLGEGRPLSPHPPIQPTDSQIEGEEDTNLGGRIVQGR